MMIRTIERRNLAKWWFFATSFFLGLLIQNVIFAQTVHHFVDGNMPPGKIAEATLRIHPEWLGHSQPVKLIAPSGSIVSYWHGGGFVDVDDHEVVVGMQLGPVYRMKVSRIKDYPGVDLYPSIELVSRLHPPAGLELKFPVPILLTRTDLESAAQGKMVTRVVYLEDPETALPFTKPDNEMETTDIGGYEDPLRVAEGLGRPMAIVRIGSRQPLPSKLREFAFYGPGTQVYSQETSAAMPAAPIQPQWVPPTTPQNIPVVEPPAGGSGIRGGSDSRAQLPAPPYTQRNAGRNTSYLQGRQR